MMYNADLSGATIFHYFEICLRASRRADFRSVPGKDVTYGMQNRTAYTRLWQTGGEPRRCSGAGTEEIPGRGWRMMAR